MSALPTYLATTSYADEYQHIEKVIRCYRSRQNVLRASARVAHAKAALDAAHEVYTWDCASLDDHGAQRSLTIADRVRNILSRAA